MKYGHQSLYFQKVKAIGNEEEGKFHTHERGRSKSEEVEGRTSDSNSRRIIELKSSRKDLLTLKEDTEHIAKTQNKSLSKIKYCYYVQGNMVLLHSF